MDPGGGLDVGENTNEDFEAFDEFNDDTFGASADAWDEDGHEELAKMTEEELRGVSAANEFFELDDNDLGESLEPLGAETINGGQDEVIEQMAALRTNDVRTSSASPLTGQPNNDPAISRVMQPPLPPQPQRPNFHQPPQPQMAPRPEFIDPAIMSMGSMPLPPPPTRAMFPAGPPPSQANAAPMTVEELERQMMAQQDQQQHLRQIQQIQQQMHHQQQQQQQQQMMHQQMMLRAQMQRQQQQMHQHPHHHQHHHHHHHQHHHHHHHQQQHQQQHQHQHQLQQQQHLHQHQQHHQHHQHRQHQTQPNQQQQQQQQQHHMHGFQNRQQQLHHQFQSHQHRHQQHHQNDAHDNFNKGRRNQRSRDEQQKIYDDKDRETFGDDFVADHQKQQDHENPLIMPGHVHVQNILRGARRGNNSSEGRGGGHDPTMSTGIPSLDLQQQRSERNENQQQQRREQRLEEDEFAGLMSQRERQWVINIQLNQLKDENDYYYAVFNQKKQALSDGIDLKKGRRFFYGEEESSDEENEDKQIFRRDDETLLLLKSESMSMDSPRDQYTPLQYENSLGKLQAVTVKAPRKIIDVMGVLNQDAEQLSSAQKDSRNFKKTLLGLERLYNIIIDVEDCEKKLAVLPTGIPLRSQVESDGKEGIRNLGGQLVREDKIKLYIAVRKGKSLLIRALRWLNTSQMRIVCATLLQNYALAVKKDRDDKLLKEFWQAGIRRHVLNCSSLSLLHYYLTLMTSDQGQPTKSGSILKNVVNTPLGMSILLGTIQRLALLHQYQPNADTVRTNLLLMTLGTRLHEDHPQEKFSACVSPQCVELPNLLFNNKDLESESYQQLQKLTHAGLLEE